MKLVFECVPEGKK